MINPHEHCKNKILHKIRYCFTFIVNILLFRYVGNLSPQVTEHFLVTLFGQIADCKSCKIIYEPGNDPYAFVELADSKTAAAVLAAMNKRNCFGKVNQNKYNYSY
jgi:RNA recognition motif-containing protein